VVLERDAGRKHIRVLVPVHCGRQPCAMELLVAIAACFNLKIVEDAAHAQPTWRRMPSATGDKDNMPDVLAAARRRLVSLYTEALSPLADHVQSAEGRSAHAWHLFPI
jgi:dTDP-4-amino-4,6-dideoxygalactose transaminase